MRRRPVVLCRAQQLVSPATKRAGLSTRSSGRLQRSPPGSSASQRGCWKWSSHWRYWLSETKHSGRRVGQRIVLVTRDVLQGDGQVPGAGMVGDEYHALAG